MVVGVKMCKDELKMSDNANKMRDRLIKILHEMPKEMMIGECADYLLANGVVALPCKVGQLAYCIIRGTYHCQMMHGTVSQVKASKDGGSFYVSINGYFGQHYTFTDVGKNVFFTREEAERASLKGGEG